jgi:hypothetical protein
MTMDVEMIGYRPKDDKQWRSLKGRLQLSEYRILLEIFQ